MYKMIFFLLLTLATFTTRAQNSIYDFKVNSVDGIEIDFNDFRGKKILIVNTASQGEQADQLAELEQLYQQFKDSGLVIVAFPTDDFSNEIRSNEQIKVSYQSNYSISFPIAAKGSVKGAGISPLYSWLTRKVQNGLMNTEIDQDFEKFLINGNGNLVGAYKFWRPMSPVIVGAIRVN